MATEELKINRQKKELKGNYNDILRYSKEANDQIKAQQIKVTNAKAAEQAKKIMTGSSKTQLGMDAPPPVPGMNAPIQPYSSVRFPKDITDPNFNVNENIFNF